MKVFKFFFSLLIVFIAVSVFREWFLSNLIIGNDFPFYYKSVFGSFSFFPPPAWNWYFSSGMGGSAAPLLWNYLATEMPVIIFGNLINQSWSIIERFGYLYPLLFLLFLPPYVTFKKFFKFPFSILALLIFTLNTYVLMLIEGGQVFIAIAYSLIPSVLYFYYKLFNEKASRMKLLFISSLLFSAEAFFDIRVAYVTLCAIGIFLFFDILFNRNYRNIFYLIMSLIISGLIHSFWILPTILIGGNPISSFGKQFTSLGMVNYLSFARFEQAISLLSPFWPENIFGKVSFMKPEFLILPILAYASLLFVAKSKVKSQRSKVQVKSQKFENNVTIQQSNNRVILFFALLGLIGAFLAKGANDPFGGIYLWMFKYVPGFIMFRDPTKWYVLVAISYSILIPFSVWKIYEWLKTEKKFLIFNFKFLIKSKFLNVQNLFLILITLYLLFLIRPAILGQLGGTFKPHTIPKDYIKLEQFLLKDNSFSRTFWVPAAQRFGFTSDIHPAISGQEFINKYNPYDVFKYLKGKNAERSLSEMAVKYVIVPDDSEGEIFLKNRNYDNAQYLTTIKDLQKIPWLKQVNCSIAKFLNCSGNPFGKIYVFEVPDPKEHFWLKSKVESRKSKISYENISPVKYIVNLRNVKKGDLLVFSESYDSHWVAIATSSKFKVQSSKYDGLFNSFVLPKNGSYDLEIYYTPQTWVNIGLAISIVTLILVLFLFLFKEGKFGELKDIKKRVFDN